MRDHEALEQLLESKKKDMAESNFNLIQVTRENQRLSGIIEGYERILQNRNPDLEKDLDAMYTFISDARRTLSIPDTTHQEEVRS